jgi:uncharacterized OsmC-like protein
VIRRIHVTYHLKLDLAKKAEAERAHRVHADNCPVASTIRNCVEISTWLEMKSS